MRRSIVVAIALFALARPAGAEVISKPDGTRFDVSPGAKITQAENNVVKLESGAVRARMPEDGRKTVRPRIVTEAATVMVLDGDAHVWHDEGKTTRVSVHRGRVSITAKGTTTEVPDGFGTQIVKGASPSKPKPLAVAPVWSAPERRTFVVSDPTTDISVPFEPLALTGSAVTAPASWHFQLAKDAAFTEIVTDSQVPLVARKGEAKALAAGTYHARASAVDADGFEGKWGTTTTVNVVRVNVERISAGRVRLSVEPSSAKCTIDGQRTTFPTDADQHQTHDIVCGEGPGAKLVIGARPLEGVRLTTIATATGPQTGSLKLVVVDVEGQPVDRLKPTVVAPSDLSVAPLVATGAPGEYVATYTFTGPPRAVPISIKLRDDWVANAGTVNFASWVSAPGEPSAPSSKDAAGKDGERGRRSLEIGAAGLAAWRGKPPIGVGGEGELRIVFLMPRGALFVGGGGSYTELLEATLEGRLVSGWIAGARALIGYRFGTGTFAPYVTLGPELARQVVELPARTGREWLLGASGAVGLDLEAGPGAIFLEVRGRAVAPVEKDEPSLTASGGLGLLGYRLRL